MGAVAAGARDVRGERVPGPLAVPQWPDPVPAGRRRHSAVARAAAALPARPLHGQTGVMAARATSLTLGGVSCFP